MTFQYFLHTNRTLAMVLTVQEYRDIRPLLIEHYSSDDIANIDDYSLFKASNERFLLCNPIERQTIGTPMMYLNAVTFVDRVPFKSVDFGLAVVV